MHPHETLRCALRAVSAITLAAGALCAQEAVSSPAEFAKAASKEIERMQQLEEADASPEQKRELDACRARLQRLVTLAGDRGSNWTLGHYVELSSVLLTGSHFADCLAVSRAGLARFADSRFLYDHVGMAQLMLGVKAKAPAQRDEPLRAAEAAFRKSLGLKPETVHAHLGLYQVLSELDRPAEALVELEAVAATEDGRKQLEDLPLRRAGLLLRCGKHREALASLEGAQEQASRVLALRAHALSGDAEKAQEAASQMAEKEADEDAVLVAADALVYLGKGDDAAKLLDQHPVVALKDESAKDTAIRKVCHASLRVLAKAKSLGGDEALRLALTKAIDHHYLSIAKGKDGKPEKVDYSTSPVLMSSLLCAAPESAKEWAERILLVYNIRALPGHKPSPGEQALVALQQKGGQAFPDKSWLPMVLGAMRRGVAEPGEAGALTALRVAELVEGPKPASRGK